MRISVIIVNNDADVNRLIELLRLIRFLYTMVPHGIRIEITLEKKLSRDDELIAQKTVCVLLVRGEDQDDQPIYAYVAVRADRLQEFMAAQSTGTFYPEDFGVIVEAGEGEPSDEVRQRMETEYGFNHQGQIEIEDPDAAYDVASNITEVMPMRRLD